MPKFISLSFDKIRIYESLLLKFLEFFPLRKFLSLTYLQKFLKD